MAPKRRTRVAFTMAQRAEVWRRRQRGETLVSIAAATGREAGTIQSLIKVRGGVAPHRRQRARQALSLAEREAISRGIVQALSVRAIARTLGRAASTIAREITRNGGRERYRAVAADGRAWRAGARPKRCRLALHAPLCAAVATALAHAWSPQQTVGWLRMTFPDEPTMHVSHETIYRTLFVQTRGALKRELIAQLRSRRPLRRSQRATRHGQARGQIVDAVSIRERPADVADRAVPGHWEGDLLAGARNSHIATLVERASRYVHLVHVTGKDTASVVGALIREVRRLPGQLMTSLTWDRGHEMAAHKQLTIATDVQVYFCDPRSPWQRGSNENTNGLLRQYFPKGTSLAQYTQADLDAVAHQLNTRPRMTLGFRTPAQFLHDAVATTD